MRHRLVAAALTLTLTTLLSAGPVRAQAQQDAALAALIDDLVAANHILYHQGIVDGYGHVSVRHPTRPDHFLMSRARAPGLVTRDDVMEFDSEANPVDRGGRPIYSERFIHSEVYKARADVKAVVHSHSPTVVPFSVTQVTLRPVIAVSSGITNLLVSDAARGKALAETLAQHPVALMRGHGDVVVGPDLRRTVARAIYTEVNARLQLQAVTLGGPINFIAPEEAALMEKGRDAAEQGHGANRTWEMWKEEANRRSSAPAR
jgi:HCOMODA/2-hydroxy-3-carboxy-muconic semialdehyde decarboxylase